MASTRDAALVDAAARGARLRTLHNRALHLVVLLRQLPQTFFMLHLPDAMLA